MANFPGSRGGENARHGWRLFLVWAVASAVIDPLFYLLVGPHLPPGTMGSNAAADQFDANVIFILAIPVAIAVNLYLFYAVVVWRAKRGTAEPVVGPSARSNIWAQSAWIGLTTVIVTGLFLFGTIELIINQGSGGGEGPAPIWTPTSKTVFPVQVIAQQWKFSYRYPTFGGFETDQLYLPDNTTIAFHVTSLDVIHSFWAYLIGVKADANPGQDNVAFTKTQQLGTFTVRCNELCGIWHGAMFNYGHIVTKSAFMAWATHEQSSLAANTKLLPPFSWTYTPDANGAAGGYYPDNVDKYSKVEIYGATPVSPKQATNPKA
ncbi:MAG: cytochrome c oxidase subunit II [Acidimicrobiales bacterium]